MNNKAIISTILVVQLILLILITFSTVKLEKDSFANTINVDRIAAFRLTSTYNAITEDMNNLAVKGADNQTINQYIYFVNSTFNNYFSSQVTFNQTYLAIRDQGLEMQKVKT
jgi:hypothetical protein